MINTLKKISLCFILFPALCAAAPQVQAVNQPIKIGQATPFVRPSPAAREADIQSFIQQMVKKHQFNEAKLTKLIAQASVKENILQAISRPAEQMKPWHQYKKIFLTPQRTQEGIEFWNKHEKTLERAHQKYGVPPEIIVGIIGVETFYGKQKGSYRVLDSLVTLAFDYPPRAAFFKGELEEFLLMTREEKLDPTQLMGSYAGAMGMPQFISSSYRRHAVDFSGKGKRDLINNTQDAIGSVANYFIAYGWKPNEAVIFPAITKGSNSVNALQNLDKDRRNPEPKYTLDALNKQGIHLEHKPITKTKLSSSHSSSLTPQTPLAVIELEEESGPTYWLGLNNFYVITRYNHSNHYAMAVYQLAQALKAQREKQS